MEDSFHGWESLESLSNDVDTAAITTITTTTDSHNNNSSSHSINSNNNNGEKESVGSVVSLWRSIHPSIDAM